MLSKKDSKVQKNKIDYKKIAQPEAEKRPKELTIHGDTRIDNYFWLNERDNLEVINYLEAENAYVDTVLSHTKQFQKDLFEEMKGRIKEDDASVPYKKNGYYYYTRYEEGKEYPIYCRKKDDLEGEEIILLDANIRAKAHDYYNATGLVVSDNNKLLAFGEDVVSRRIYTIRIKNLETGEILKDEIPETVGYVAWANDNKTLFYTLKDETTLRPYKVMRHLIGTDISEDEEVFNEADETFYTYCWKSKSGDYIFIGSFSTLTTEYNYLSADDPDGKFKPVQPRIRALEYKVAHFDDHFYIITNADGAENFKLVKAPVDNPQKDNWQDIIPHRSDVFLEDMTLFQNYLVLQERIKGINNIRVLPWENFDKGHYVDFGENAYLASTKDNYDFDTETVRLSYTSMTTPRSVFDYNMSTKELTLKKEQEVLGTFDKHNYKTERIYAKARDGEEVPISIVYKKGFKKNSPGPLLLYAYGSYGNSMDPYFSSIRLSLLNRGFAFAIAHIRGGQELGRRWYEDGKLLNKKNTFYDFIDCAEFLIEEGYTASKQLFAMGGSAGGLLMGAVANLRPDLWKGVLASVPFVDVVTTMLDESIPLTTGEFDEWGNPKEEEYYHYIKSYSPYDNVEAKPYPSMLITTGLHDSQVQYWEPAKWVAKLRDLKRDDNVLLFKTDMSAGHGGASGRFEALKDIALEYVFMFDLLGIEE